MAGVALRCSTNDNNRTMNTSNIILDLFLPFHVWCIICQHYCYHGLSGTFEHEYRTLPPLSTLVRNLVPNLVPNLVRGMSLLILEQRIRYELGLYSCYKVKISKFSEHR